MPTSNLHKFSRRVPASTSFSALRMIRREVMAQRILVQRGGIAAIGGAEGSPNVEVDVVGNEASGAVAESGINAVWMTAAGRDRFFGVGVRVGWLGIGMVLARRVQAIRGGAGLLGNVWQGGVRSQFGLEVTAAAP